MKSKLLWIFGIILLPLGVVGRTVQLLNMTEPTTGFFKKEFAGLGIGMGVLLGLCFVALLVMTYMNKQSWRKPEGRSLPVAVAAFLLAAAQLYEAATVMLSDNRVVFATVLHMLLLFGSVAFFAMLGISRISDLPLPRTLTVLPVLLWVYKLVAAFIDFTGIANIAENMVTTAMLCFSLLFMLEQGKFLSGDRKKTGRWLLGGGLCTAVLCAVSTLPRYIVLVMGRTDLLHDGQLPNPTDLVLAVYVLVFIGSLFTWNAPVRSGRGRPAAKDR